MISVKKIQFPWKFFFHNCNQIFFDFGSFKIFEKYIFKYLNLTHLDNIFSPKCKEKNCPEIIKCNFHSTCYYKQLSVFFFVLIYLWLYWLKSGILCTIYIFYLKLFTIPSYLVFSDDQAAASTLTRDRLYCLSRVSL